MTQSPVTSPLWFITGFKSECDKYDDIYSDLMRKSIEGKQKFRESCIQGKTTNKSQPFLIHFIHSLVQIIPVIFLCGSLFSFFILLYMYTNCFWIQRLSLAWACFQFEGTDFWHVPFHFFRVFSIWRRDG